ncbi:MAG: hypothetical protein R3D62_05410 [Xanthobacteraceae bacterium]
MSLLSLDYAVSLPDEAPRKKSFLARAYGALYRSRMAQVERLLAVYRPLLDDIEASRKANGQVFKLD